MIDERTHDRSVSKKVDGGGNCTKLGQSPKNSFSKIKTQTFTKIKSIFCVKIASISKESFHAVLNWLRSFVRSFLPNISKAFSSRNRGLNLKNQSSGYVLILILATLPVLLLGAKYVLDQRTLNDVQMNNQAGKLYNQDGSKSALLVAQNWNPGLTLNQQKDAVYKIADAAYNSYWGFTMSLAVPGLDIPQYEKVNKQYKTYDPIQIQRKETISTGLDSNENLIKYTDATNYLNRRYYKREKDNKATWNPNYALWRSIDVNTRPEYRQSKYDEINEDARAQGRFELIHHDIYKDPSLVFIGHICKLHNEVYYPNNTYHSNSCSSDHPLFAATSLAQGSANAEYSPTHYDKFEGITEGNYSSIATKYKARPSLNPDPVEISIAEDDSIKVTTGGDTGYAEPARCNVDIVLAIPVNGAANNADNRDAASDTAGTPLEASGTSIPSSVKNTPIYQMGQACKEFVKKHFYHTRGISMGLIPYSAKVSLSPDKVGYTTAITPFNSNSTKEYQQKIIGSCLYSTSGVRGANLTQGYKTTSLETNQTLPTTDTCYYWGGILTGCPIMCRRGTVNTFADYSGNTSAQGLLLNTNNPSDSDDYKFMRMNLNPCYMGYANFLSMQCERQCTHFLPNPYYMIEPTADMVKIYEMCNALYPIYDKQNVSNFVFIPVEWTLNFWQSWTDDPGRDKVSGKVNTSTLSVPSKMDTDTSPERKRKKALILIVNKPDWFEPGELTYLGFDNDASEIPMAESDKIDFSIDYSDTTKKFLDGTNYNTEYTSGEFKGIKNKNSDDTPLVAGPKKIIKYEKISGNMAYNSDYEIYEDEGTSQIRLKIPRPAQVKITVASASGGISRNWKYYSQALNPSGQTAYTSYWGSYYWSSRYDSLLTYGNGRFVCLNYNYNVSAWSEDGVTWNRGGSPGTTSWCGLAWNGTNFVAITYNKYVSYSADGNTWNHYGSAAGTLNTCLCQGGGLVWDTSNNRFYIVNDSGYAYTTTSATGTSGWSSLSSSGSNRYSEYESTAYGNGYYVQYYSGYIRYSTNGYSWTTVSRLPQSKYGSMTFGNGTFYIICGDGTLIYATNPTAKSNWTYLDGSSASQTSLNKVSGRSDWTAVCYGDGKLVAVSQYGDVAVTKVRTTTNSTTTSTIQSNSLPSTSAYTITNLTTLTVDPSKITETDDEGNYIIDFTCTNLELISAEVTNCIIDTVNPINVTYKDADFDGSNGVLSWSTRSVSEAARTIDVASSGTVAIDSPCVEMTDSTGKLKIASDQLKYVNGYGWVPKHANQDVLLKITSNRGGALTLNVGKWDNGTITFYKDNIGDTSDVHRDSLSGTTVSLPSQQIITADDQKFVFSGANLHSASTDNSISHYSVSSYGKNFSANLSTKKVRYSLSNAKINGCTLTNQVIRYYGDMYTNKNNYDSYTKKTPLILNDGVTTENIVTSSRCTYDSSGNDPWPLKKDTCITFTTKANVACSWQGANNFSINAYGISRINRLVTNHYSTQTVTYETSNGNWSSQMSSYGIYHFDLHDYTSAYSADSYVKLSFSGSTGAREWGFFIENYDPKTLQKYEGTDNPIIVTTNPIEYQDLIENKGVYLAHYKGERWICFQGDGELEVTTKPEERDGLYYVKYNNTQTNVTSDSQDYSASWYSSANDSFDSNCDSDGPLYHTYILLHNVYLKSVTQAAGNKTVRTLRSTKQQDIKLVVGPNTSDGFRSNWTYNSSYSYMRQGVTYGNGMFVLVGGQNSSGSGSFYAIGSNSHTYVSTPDSFRGVAYDEDDAYFYAVTTSGNIYRANKTSSNTLSSWSSYVSEGCPISGINRIACGNGHIVVQNTSAQSATYNKASGTWSGIVTQPATCYALCFGAGKFICMSYSTSSTVYSSVDGSSWTQIGSTTFRSYNACSVCYGNGRFLATDRYGYSINISTDGGSTWNRAFNFNSSYYTYDICYGFNGFFGIYGSYNSTGTSSDYYYLRYFYPRLSGSEYKSNRWQVKIGSRSPQQITSRTVFTIAASELTWDGSYYYVDVDIDAGYRRIRWATTGHTTSATVDDLIDFNSGERNGKNGILQATGSYTSNNGYCVANGAPNVSSSHRGRFELRYSYSLGSNSTGMSTSTIQKASMTHSGGRYYYNWNWGTSCVLLYLRFYHEPEMLYPYGFGNSLNLDWRDNSLGIPSGLSVSSYSNYNTTYGYHQFRQSNCSPTMYRSYTGTGMLYPYTSDISVALDVRQSLLANIVMPEYTSTRTAWLTGVTRLFSQQKRDSTYRYCYLQPYSTTYDNTASLLSTNFTVPINRVLSANGYQSSGTTPTAAVSSVTAAACTKLKNTYGSDLRIYVVKYKPQANFNSFPYQNKSSVATAHSYTTVENCATSSDYRYSASTPDELNEVLDQIAQDIKSASFGNWQKAQNTE